MSDNIDYAELDKAVSEAAAKDRATAATAPRRPINTVTQKPHGQYMDFVNRHPQPVSAKRPLAPTKPVVAKPVTRPIARPTAPTMVKRATSAPHPAIARPVAQPALHHPTQSSTLSQQHSVAAQIEHKQQLQQQHEETAKATVERPEPVNKATTSPNANNYSLGGRSPFMTNTKVEKRPLGHNVPETNVSTLHSTKNIYSQKSPSKLNRHAKHTVTEAPKKHSGWLWTLIVLLVIAAGGGLGYLAYLLVFTNQF